MKTKTKLLILLLFCVNTLLAQKFAGGEIRVQQTGTYSVVATVDIFTSINDDLTSIELCWGDGSCEDIPLVYSESFSGSNLKFHQFQQSHVYGQEEYYTLSVSECCWSSNIINIENGETEDFLLSTYFFLSVDDQFFGENMMPFFYRGLLEGHQGLPIFYESDFFDFEEDEIHVEICDLEEILTYFKPTDVVQSPLNMIFLDTMTSSFVWTFPQLEGKYVLALCVTETRNGTLISEYTRKMIIAVDGPVANKEILAANQINIFPNPVREKLTITVPENWKDIEITVLDVMGRKIYTDFIENQLDVSTLSKGLYWLQVKSGNQFYIKKIIII
jgi:type IX secretion system substrate protein